MKRIITIITSVVLSASLLCSCGFDKAAYTAAVKSLNDDITAATITLGNYGNYIQSYWRTIDTFNANAPGIHSSFDADVAIEYANSWLAENSEETRDTMDKAFADIKAKYSVLPEAKTNDPTIKELSERISIAYEDYCELYSIVTNPSGSDVKVYVTSISNTLSELSDMTEEISNTLSE